MRLKLQKPCFRDVEFNLSLTGWDQYISQYFYQNNSSIYSEQGKLGHGAIDLRTPLNTPVYAMHDGYVLEATNDNASSLPDNPTGTDGLFLRIVTDREYDYGDKQSYYWTSYVHLSEFKVKRDDYVKAGDLIALSGNTGYSTGPHTHIGLAPVYKSWVWNYYYKQEPDNGFAGYINPMPFIKNMFERIKIKDKKDQYIVWNNNEVEVIPDEETVKKYIGKIFDVRLEEITQEQFDALGYKIIGKFPSEKLMRIFAEVNRDIYLPE